MKKMYSALVRDGNTYVVIENQEYPSMSAFIKDLRAKGFKVNKNKVKESEKFSEMVAKTNTDTNSFDFMLIRCNEKTYLAEYEDGEKEIIHANRDLEAIEESEKFQENHGMVLNLFEIDDSFKKIKTIFIY